MANALKRRGSLTIWFEPEMTWPGMIWPGMTRDAHQTPFIYRIYDLRTRITTSTRVISAPSGAVGSEANSSSWAGASDR